ncbi:hypothetical protein OIU78_000373 [Salix suchowensis]|nr:hypothetical protein OIU78_000373 [Salix suchowensis]
MRVNPRELNPYFKDNGSGYPDDGVEKKVGGDQLPPTSLIGDGGASGSGRLWKKDGIPLVNWLSLQHLGWLPHRSRAHRHAKKRKKQKERINQGTRCYDRW